MSNFVWRVTDRSGKQVIREITADTSNEAKEILLTEGCTNLALMSDEIGDVVRAGMPTPVFLGEQIKTTAEERLKNRGKAPPTLFSILAAGIWQSKGLVALILLVGGFGVYRGDKIVIIVSGVALVAWMVFLVGMRLPAVYHRKLHKAAEWHRWEEVLQLINTLEKISKLHFIKIPPAMLGRYRAKAVAGLGNLDAALREYQQYENQPGCPSWLYKVFVGGIYDTAKQYDKGLEYNLMALAEKPSSVLYLDLASRYMSHKKDAAKARQALAEAEKRIVPDLAVPSYHRFKGTLLYLEGDYAAAKQEIETAIQMMEKTRHVPFRDGSISVAKAYLCCVLARLGDSKGAEKNYRDARAYLEATDETELINECKAALGKK